jgi:hypothetical protein
MHVKDSLARRGGLWLRPHSEQQRIPFRRGLRTVRRAFGCFAIRTVPGCCLTKAIFSISVADLENEFQ